MANGRVGERFRVRRAGLCAGWEGVCLWRAMAGRGRPGPEGPEGLGGLDLVAQGGDCSRSQRIITCWEPLCVGALL